MTDETSCSSPAKIRGATVEDLGSRLIAAVDTAGALVWTGSWMFATGKQR